jgi:CheY-like chemotaxis protein
MPLENPPTILVIDDDEVSLALICMMLDAEGYRVLPAAAGEEALKKAAELPGGAEPSVVLADLQMPGLCGRELALALRTLLPHAMLVAMSATPGPVEAYDGFVDKPLDLAAFRALVEGRPEGLVEARQERPVASPAGGDRSAILNEEIYLKLQRMMPPAALAEVYEVCLNDARQRAGQMHQLAEEDGSLAAVRKSAHAIKGGAGMIGASKLAHAAAELEQGVYTKDDLAKLINNLLSCCDDLQRILMTKVKPRLLN